MWVCKDQTVCADVCDGQEPPGSTFCGRDVDATTSPIARTRDVCNGYDVPLDVDYNIHSSTMWVYKDHTVCADVCDGQEPPGSTFCGRDVDATPSPNTRTRDVCITVMT